VLLFYTPLSTLLQSEGNFFEFMSWCIGLHWWQLPHFLIFMVSSLRRGNANLLYIVPILICAPKGIIGLHWCIHTAVPSLWLILILTRNTVCSCIFMVSSWWVWPKRLLWPANTQAVTSSLGPCSQFELLSFLTKKSNKGICLHLHYTSDSFSKPHKKIKCVKLSDRGMCPKKASWRSRITGGSHL